MRGGKTGKAGEKKGKERKGKGKKPSLQKEREGRSLPQGQGRFGAEEKKGRRRGVEEQKEKKERKNRR